MTDTPKENVDSTKNENTEGTSSEQLKLAIPDVYTVAQALELAIKRKAFEEGEILKIYKPWSNVMRFCEDIRRKTEIEELYKKTTTAETKETATTDETSAVAAKETTTAEE